MEEVLFVSRTLIVSWLLLSLPAFADEVRKNGQIFYNDGGTVQMHIAELPIELAAAGAPISASLSELPQKIALPPAGGTTTVNFKSANLSVSATPKIVMGSVAIIGGVLTIKSNMNTTGAELSDQIVVSGDGPNDPQRPRVHGTLTIGVTQALCKTCQKQALATGPRSSALAESPVDTREQAQLVVRPRELDWKYIAEAVRASAAPGVNAIRIIIDGSDSDSAITGVEISHIIGLCKQQQLLCILEMKQRSVETASDSNATVSSRYFLEPDVHSALYGQSDSVILYLREANFDEASWQRENIRLIRDLRASGLTHTIFVDGSGLTTARISKQSVSAVVHSDSHQNALVAMPYRRLIADGSDDGPLSGVSFDSIVGPFAAVSASIPASISINNRMLSIDNASLLFGRQKASQQVVFRTTNAGKRSVVRRSAFILGATDFQNSLEVLLGVDRATQDNAGYISFSDKSATIGLVIDVFVKQAL